ncbi:MAG: hypothetical protein LBQ80_04485 [Clostridium sp.]|nr:hypothetical protein [Clostridium sp.]
MRADFFWSERYHPKAANTVALRGCYGAKKQRLLSLLAAYCGQAELYCAPLRPQQLAAVYLPDRDVIFADGDCLTALQADKELSLDGGCDWSALCGSSAALASIAAKVRVCDKKYARFFKAARLLQQSFSVLDKARLDRQKLRRCALRLCRKELPPQGGHIGLETRRMLSCMCGGGMATHFLTIARLCAVLIIIEDFAGAAGSALLQLIRGRALAGGTDVIFCPSPMDDSAAEFLFMPALMLGVCVCNRFHRPRALIAALEEGKRFERMRILRTERFYLPQAQQNLKQLRFLHRAQWELLEEASAALARRDKLLAAGEGIYAAAGRCEGLASLAAQALALAGLKT